MIGKTTIGKDFGGLVRYVMNQEKSQVLSAHGVRMDTAANCTKDFNTIRKGNWIENAVWHTSISFAPEDVVNNDLMVKVAYDMIQGLGLGKSQFLVVRHRATKHEHLHIVTSRTQADGTVVSDSFCKNRTASICDQLEIKYSLTIARHHGKSMSTDKAPELALIKKELRKILASGFDAGIASWEELSEYLTSRLITFKIDKAGWKLSLRGRWIKASAIDRSFSKGRIDKRFLTKQKNYEQEKSGHSY